MEISAIIPTFNDEPIIEKTLVALSRLVNVDEVVIVDGGSTDKTTEIVENYQQQLKRLKLVKLSEHNRGMQMHEGTRHASGDIFWFIHPDVRPVQGSGRQIKANMRFRQVVGGNFAAVFDGKSRRARLLTRLFPYFQSGGIIYGETAVFARRETYEKVKGFRPLAVLEDVDLARRLQKRGRFVHVNLPVTVSARRFEAPGYWRPFARRAFFQAFLWAGVPPRVLSRNYRKVKEKVRSK